MSITINWKIHCKSDINSIFNLLNTDEGRSKFWAESAKKEGNSIHFIFPNGQEYVSAIKEIKEPNLFSIDYFKSDVSFKLSEAFEGGTDLELINSGVDANEFTEVKAGWISVLLSMKAAIDYNVDLRNHNPHKNWDSLYVDN